MGKPKKMKRGKTLKCGNCDSRLKKLVPGDMAYGIPKASHICMTCGIVYDRNGKEVDLSVKFGGDTGVDADYPLPLKTGCVVCGEPTKKGAQFCSRKCYNEARRFESKRRI